MVLDMTYIVFGGTLNPTLLIWMVGLFREMNYMSSSPARTFSNTSSPRRFPPFSPAAAFGMSPRGEMMRFADVSHYSGSSCSATARTYGAHHHRQRHHLHHPCVTAVGFHGAYPSGPAQINRSYHFF